MSASFYYSPVTARKRIGGGTSNTATEIRDIFGNLPVTLTKEHYASVHALALAGHSKEFWGIIEGILDVHDAIVLDVEY